MGTKIQRRGPSFVRRKAGETRPSEVTAALTGWMGGDTPAAIGLSRKETKTGSGVQTAMDVRKLADLLEGRADAADCEGEWGRPCPGRGPPEPALSCPAWEGSSHVRGLTLGRAREEAWARAGARWCPPVLGTWWEEVGGHGAETMRRREEARGTPGRPRNGALGHSCTRVCALYAHWCPACYLQTI